MDYLSKAKNIEQLALARGFFSGEAAWLKSKKPFTAVSKAIKWLKSVKIINVIVKAVSAAFVYIQSYALVFVLAGALATLSAAFLLLALPVLATAYLSSLSGCRKEAARISGISRPVCFVFLSKKLSMRPFARETLAFLAEKNEVYVVTGSVSVGVNGGKRKIGDGVSFIHRVYYHRLKKELTKRGFDRRVAIVI